MFTAGITMSERFACDVQQPLQEPSREKKAWEHTSCSGRELRVENPPYDVGATGH